MSSLSIHEKRQLAEQLAREQLSKSGQYRFGIPQSVLNAKANEFMRLSDKEIQKKFNEYFQSTGLNAKPKDLWDSMGLNLEQKKKAEAHMKGLQKQINTKYMQPQKAVSKKSTTTKNELPSDVKLETRQIIVNMLKQAYANKNEEFRTYLLNNRGNFAEGAMELHDLSSKIADGLTDLGIVVVRSETRAEIHDKLLKKEAEIDVLADSIKDEKAFNELFKKYFHEDFDYQTAFDYICASSEFTTQDSANKIKKFDKKFESLAGKDLKSADDYMSNANRTGGLLDLGFQVGLMYASGGFSAIAKYAQMTAKGGVELAENVVTKVAGKKFAQSAAGKAVLQGVGIVSAQTTSAGANAVAFQTTKVAELAGESIATGHVDTEKANAILEGTESLFKFGYVGGAISGPLGMQVKGLTTKLLNSKPIINQILTKGITNKPTPLTSVLKDISEHSEAIGEVLKFGTEFGINAGYMAYDEGVSYTDAMANLAQMDGVSKMVIAMLGGKNLEFLTPKKVQQIKTDLAGYKVNVAIYEGQKVYSVKDAKGKETVLATPEELFMFILDKEAQKVGVKAETAKSDNTPRPNPLPQGAREQGEVRTEGTKKPYVTPETVIKNFTFSDDLLASEVATETTVPRINNILDKVFDETTIPKTKAILEEMGLTKEEIASIDLKDSNKQRAIEALNNALKYMPKLKMEITKDEILSFLKSSNDEFTTFLSDEAKFFTDDNCKLLAKHVIFDDGGDLREIFNDYNNPQVIMELLPVLTQNGKHKLLGSELQLLGYFLDNPNNVAKITPENIDLLYKINEKIEDKNFALELSDILNFENTTPEFVDNYVKETNRFAKFGLKKFSEKDLQERINIRKTVSDFLEEYPIDVTTYDYINKQNAKLSGSDVYRLSQYSNKAEVQKFVNSLSTKARTQFCGCADFVDKGFPTEKLANLLNEAVKNDFGEIKDGIYNLLNKMLETGSKDYNSMVDLVMAYKGTTCLSWLDNEKYVQVANGDFKGAVKYVELAKELKMNPEYYKDLISDKAADFNVATSNLAYVKENGIDINLYDRYTLLRDKKFKINNEKIKYLEAQGITRLDDMYLCINKEFESNISVEEFKAKFEYINEFIAKNQNTNWQRRNSDYFKVEFANNELSMKQIRELLELAEIGNLSPTMVLDLLQNTNNLKYKFAKKLCADKDFPKDQIANIIRVRNKDNQTFIETLCANKNVPKDKICEILKATVINDPNDAGGNNGKTDAKKVDRYTRLFQNPNTAKWAGDMLKQGFDIETISKLAPTKQSFFTESVKPTETTQKVVEEKTVSPIDVVKQETIQEFENLGLDTKQANAVFKSIAKNGVVDTSLKAKAIELINKGVAKNKIGDILNSAQITGEFNSKIVEDFVLLQNKGLNPLLEKNLAVLNNISGADCAVKFNSKVRNQIKAMINNLPDAVKISLKEQRIEIDSILKKLDSQVVRTSNNVPTRAKVESGFRSKAKITGFERIVVDKYEPNEQVWRNEDATKKWAEEKYLAFKNREYVSTRNTAEDPQLGEKVTQKRKEMLEEWYNFMETDENLKNNPFVKVILCDFITKELEPERSTTPPALNKDVVKQILGEAANSSNFSFSNAYAKKMKELSAKNSQGQQVEVNGRKGTWYTVPKTDSSSSDFKANAAKIRAFSDGTNWCIRTWNAEPYVQRGAMHFFVDENGLTQICIREQGEPGSVYEIQKRQQDQTAPVAYLDVIQSYMKEHELKPQSYCQGELDKAIKQKPEYDKLKSELDVLNNKKDYKGILEKMGITVTILPDGTFELSHYTSYIDKIALNDFGINENELLANVSRIKGNANFKDSNATTLPNLSEVGGILDFGYANISNIKNLKSINGQEIKW